MFDPIQAKKERDEAKRYADLTVQEKENLHRTTSVRLWSDATPDTLFTRNRKGEWCRIS